MSGRLEKESRLPPDFPIGRIRLSEFLSKGESCRPKSVMPLEKYKDVLKRRFRKPMKKAALFSGKDDEEEKEKMKDWITRGLGEAMIGIAVAAGGAKMMGALRRYWWRRMTPEQRMQYIYKEVGKKIQSINPFAKQGAHPFELSKIAVSGIPGAKKAIEKFMVSQGLPKDTDYVLTSGAAMAAHGIPRKVRDLDLFIPSLPKKKVTARVGKFEVEGFKTWLSPALERKSLREKKSIGGIKVMSLKSIIATKKKLDRPKDRKDIKLIRSFMKGHTKAAIDVSTQEQMLDQRSLGRGEFKQEAATMLPWIMAKKKVMAKKMESPFLQHVNP